MDGTVLKMFIISDDILERLLCSQCKKYLSVKPIKVYPNLGIKCGRCSSKDDAGVVSLFDMVAGESLFRCVNRYEGCNKLLFYSEVAEHEKACDRGYYDCPLCVDFHGSAYEILQHYKSDHSDKFLEAAEFLVELENESYNVYLYKKNDFLFFVNVKFSISEDELIIMIEYVGPKPNAKKINQIMNIYTLEGPVIKKSKKNICSAGAEQHARMFKFNLKLEDFPKKIAICKFALDTEAIESLLAVPENHFKFSFRSQSSTTAAVETTTTVTKSSKGILAAPILFGGSAISTVNDNFGQLNSGGTGLVSSSASAGNQTFGVPVSTTSIATPRTSIFVSQPGARWPQNNPVTYPLPAPITGPRLFLSTQKKDYMPSRYSNK